MNPQISIIIPVYNTEKFLSACLNSMRAQTFKEIEVLCVNDGSTDRSAEILAECEGMDSRFRVFDQENAGPASARNRGLAEARGKYVMFCDSDDWYEPNMCERMYRSIEDQNVDFVMCNTIIEDIDHETTIPLTAFFPRKQGRYSLSDQFRMQLNTLVWNKIFRKSLIDQYSVSFPGGMYGREDDLFCRSFFFIAKNVYLLDEKLYHYVQRTGSFMDSWQKDLRYEDFLLILQVSAYFYNFLERHHLLKKKENLFCRLYLRNLDYVMYHLPARYRREILERTRKEILQFHIGRWPLLRPYKLKRALQTGDDRTVIRILFHVPADSTLLFRTVKYALLESISWGKIRKKYRRKKIKVLYEFRRLERFLSFAPAFKEESK